MRTRSYLPILLTLVSSAAFAQTPTGQDVNAVVSGYTYIEPGDTSISIHAPKFGGEYTATLPIDEQRHWFAQGNVRGSIGTATYKGWCSPYLITPSSTSPNGYRLGIGDPSPCTESGDKDWYLEGRALAGKDLIGQGWTYSPYSGVGLRHLSNGTTGVNGYRTDDYLYVPLGITARNSGASHTALAFNVEFDPLIHGWQKTRDSALGGGFIPATPFAPAFTINGFSDVSFSQHAGWALRASARYQVARHLSMEPYYLHWHVSDSPVSYETASFTVNRITAEQQLGAYEPMNVTHEFGVKLGVHF
ncbi:MAG TPA: hypothetical protein VL693_04230 [Vicinamibacterales bacterium]|nr:hypothetical protein [Vicinamibacterales bacterium]